MCRLTIASASSLSLEGVIKFVYAAGRSTPETLAPFARIRFRLARQPRALPVSERENLSALIQVTAHTFADIVACILLNAST